MKRSLLESMASLPADFPLPLDRPFTYRTAQCEAGLDGNDLGWLVQRGFLTRPIKGVYVASQVPDSIELRCACLRLAVPPDAVIVDRHAGWLHGAEMVLAPGEHLDLAPIRVFLPAGRGRLRNGLSDSGERTLPAGDIVEVDGVRVTSTLRTTCDLGMTKWHDRSLAGMDQMLRLDAFTKEELVAEVERFRRRRWVRVLRLTAGYVDGRAESPPESVLRWRWIELGLPAPVPQLEVWDGGHFVARLDLANEELRYAAEYDGVEWHSSPEQQARDRERRAACAERGWLITSITKDDLFGTRPAVGRLLRAGIDDARARRGLRVP